MPSSSPRPLPSAVVAVLLVTLAGCDIGPTEEFSPLGYVGLTLSRQDGEAVGALTLVAGLSEDECATGTATYPFPDEVPVRVVDTRGRQQFVEGLIDVEPGPRRCLLLAVGPDRNAPGAADPLGESYVPDTVLALPVALDLRTTAPHDTVAVNVAL